MKPINTPSFFLVLAILAAWAAMAAGCEARKTPDPSQLTADQIVQQALAAMGAAQIDSANISFTLRGRMYAHEKWGPNLTYHRAFRDSAGNEFHDILRGDSLFRTYNGKPIALTDKERETHFHSLNSVMYFALLPYKINDPAARRERLPDFILRDQTYHKVRVTFSPEGGGKDFEDEFVYWFRAGSFDLDFLAYRFHTGKGGVRFREAFHPQAIAGITLRNYHNYQYADHTSVAVEALDSLFLLGRLEWLSDITLEEVAIRKMNYSPASP